MHKAQVVTVNRIQHPDQSERPIWSEKALGVSKSRQHLTFQDAKDIMKVIQKQSRMLTKAHFKDSNNTMSTAVEIKG